jgi:hypothetical protein
MIQEGLSTTRSANAADDSQRLHPPSANCRRSTLGRVFGLFEVLFAATTESTVTSAAAVMIP